MTANGADEDPAVQPPADDDSASSGVEPGESGPTEPSESAAGDTNAVRSVLAVGAFTLLSRIAGLGRDATRAYFLGAGAVADAFQVAFMIPNVLRRLVGEGAVSSALVPVFTEYARDRSESEQVEFAERFLSFWIPFVAVVTAVGMIVSGAFVSLAFSFGSFAAPEKIALTASLTRFLFVYLFFVGVGAAFQGLLHARGIFAVPSAGPALFNLVFIAVAWWFAPGLDGERERVFVIAGAVLVGGAFQLALLVPLIWRGGVRPRFRWPFRDAGVRRVLVLFVPAVFGAGIYQINVLLSTVLAGRLDEEGAVTVLAYSNRLMEFVLGVYVFALGTVSLTSLSRLAAAGDDSEFREGLFAVLRWVLFITVPSAVGLFVLREPVLDLLFRAGAFDEKALAKTARAFRYHVPGVIFVGLSRILVNAFYARKDVATPVRIAAVNLVAHVGLAYALSEGEFSFAGIALASTVTAVLQVILLWSTLASRVSGLSPLRLAAPAARTVIAATAMGGVVWACVPWVDDGVGKLELAWRLGAVISLGAGGFFAFAAATGLEEARHVVRGIQSTFRRGGPSSDHPDDAAT